jgi:imidazolonepropionase-like amidohydrolase
VHRGELKLKCNAHRADDILTALRLSLNLPSNTIEHCTEGHLILDVQEKYCGTGAGLLGPLLSERAKIEMKNLTYHAKAGHDAGITVCPSDGSPRYPHPLPACVRALCVATGWRETALSPKHHHAANITGWARA